MVTKSTGVGRGGKRSGAGRKPKSDVRSKAVEREVSKAVETIASAAPKRRAATKAPKTEETSRATALLAKAYATLEDVMDNSPFPAPRVTAARAVIDLAMAETAPASSKAAGVLGKKEAAKAAAKSMAAGRFATPPAPPKLVVDNR